MFSRRPGLRRAVALTAAMLVFAGTAPSEAVERPDSGPGLPGVKGHTKRPDGQRWGSAAGLDHLDGSAKPVKADGPQTLHGKYAVEHPDTSVPDAHNEAEVKEAPAKDVKGYDPKSSTETPDKRDEFQRTFTNQDGSQTTQFSKERLNYRAGDGSWQPIDARLVPSGDKGAGGWRNAADSLGISLAARADARDLARLVVDGDHEVSFGLEGAQPSAGRIEEKNPSAVTYPDVLKDADLELISRPGGLKEVMVLRSANAPRGWTFPLRTKGLTASVDNGDVVLKDTGGKERVRIPHGYMEDSKVNPESGDGAISTGVDYRIVEQGGGQALRVELDRDWLSAPGRAFPVRVDPPMVEPVGASSSMYVEKSGGNNWSSASEDTLKLGSVTDGGTTSQAATYLAFPGVASKLRNHKIFGASLTVLNYWSASCRPREVNVHPVTEAWTAGKGHTYPGPKYGAKIAGSSFAHGFIAEGESSSACPAAWEAIDLGTKGRDLVEGWTDGTRPNYGLTLRGSDSESMNWKKFSSTSSSNPPSLYVTHTPYNAKYTVERSAPQPPVSRGTDGKVKIKVTNLGAETWTPNTYELGYRAYKDGKLVKQAVAAQLPKDVPRGASVSLDAVVHKADAGQYLFDFSMVRKGKAVFTDEGIPPVRLQLNVVAIPPVVDAFHPANGHQSQTLSPELWANARDMDNTGQKLQYRYEVCEAGKDNKPKDCFFSDWSPDRSWVVPAGKLSWSKTYLWRPWSKDNAATSPELPYTTFLTTVPQPVVTSHLAGSPYGSSDKPFDPQVGNFATSAVDASVPTVGPDLTVTRTYNSLDPVTGRIFGAGWASRLDMRVTPDDDGTGNVVIGYPDGQQVRFGRNANGSFAPPQGRDAVFTSVKDGGWELTDKNGVRYAFRADGRLARITDTSGLTQTLTYVDGKLVQVTNDTSKRSLYFQWSGAHVTAVGTDPLGTKPLTWTYEYEGDKLTKVCSPEKTCTTYDYTAGSHYRSVALDSGPYAYWRFGEDSGDDAVSQVTVNQGKDQAQYVDVGHDATGPLSGTDVNAATFNGTSSRVGLPENLLNLQRNLAVSMWFRTTGSGVLLNYRSDKHSDSAAGSSAPVLYVGADGKLRGQFRTGGITPITAAAPVNDGNWHHAVLSSDGARQTLFVDGRNSGSLDAPVDHSIQRFAEIGTGWAYMWPSAPSKGTAYFKGDIGEVAVHHKPLGTAAAQSLYAARAQADQLVKVTTPSGRTAVEVTYDTNVDRVGKLTDVNGGQWKLGTPVTGLWGKELIRTVQVTDPKDRRHFYDYDPLAGRLIRYVSPLRDRPKDAEKPKPSVSASPGIAEGGLFEGGATGTGQPPVDYPDPEFVGGVVNAMGVRGFGYDERGMQNHVVDENGHALDMTYDGQGNVATRTNCRDKGDCQTTYYSYWFDEKNPVDPRNGKLTESRDARSKNASDNTYRTTYSYDARGELTEQTAPDGRKAVRTFTTGSEPASDGKGTMPAGLLASMTDAKGKTTRYGYSAGGDLAETTDPAGLTTRYTYDRLGRKLTETDVSDSQPQGVTVSFTYDGANRVVTTTKPGVKNKVTDVTHTQRTTVEYDKDGLQTRSEVTDLTGGDPARETRTEYDDSARPVRVTDAEGAETSYGYDVLGNRVWEVDPSGTRTETAYTPRNSVAEVRVRDWKGDPQEAPKDGTDGPGDEKVLVTDSYAYDMAGRLTRHTDAMGRTRAFSYYDDGLQKSVRALDVPQPDGSTRDIELERNEYDALGSVVRRTTGNGSLVTEYGYDLSGRTQSITSDPGKLDRKVAYSYDDADNVTRVVHTGRSSNIPFSSSNSEIVDYTYDAVGRELSETTQNGKQRLTTTFQWDQRGLLLAETEPRGNAEGAKPEDYTTTYAYDALGRRISVTEPAADVETGQEGDAGKPVKTRPTTVTGYNVFDEATQSKDPQGRLTSVDFNKAGQPTTSASPSYTPPGASEPITPISRNEYDSAGRITATTDALGNTKRFRYDQLGRMVQREEPRTSKLLGLVTEPGKTVPSGAGAVWSYTYSRTGEQLTETDPTGARTESTYDGLGRSATTTQVERKSGQTRYFTSTFTYDDADRMVAQTTPSGETTRYAYDALGQLTGTEDPAGVKTRTGYDMSGRVISNSDALGRQVRQTYDQAGRMTGQLWLDKDDNPLRDRSFRYDAAGNLVSSTDAKGKTTGFTFDAQNQLVQQMEPVASGKTITTTFGYDANGNRTRYTDGRGNTTRYTFNALGLPESTIEPQTKEYPTATDRTWTTSYDAAGNPVKLTEPGKVEHLRTYDPSGLLLRETGSGAEVSTPDRVYAYDANGRMVSATAPKGVNTYEYDDRGLLTAARGGSGDATFGYDEDGRLLTRVDAAGTAVFGYEKGRLKSVKDAQSQQLFSYRYDKTGALEGIDSPGVDRSFGYDALGRQTSDVTKSVGSGTVLATAEYRFDDNDRLISKKTTGTADAGEQKYGYDDAGRLTSWTDRAGKTTAYGWDDSGNRVQSGDRRAAYDARNQLMSDGDSTYTYSPRGTRKTSSTSGLVEESRFDAFGQLAKQGETSYEYDAFGRLVDRDGTQHTYSGLGDDVVTDGRGVYSRGLTGELISVTQGGTTRLAMDDRHGDVVGTVDAKDTDPKSLASSAGFDPFGRTTATAGEQVSIGYQGDWTDPKTQQVSMAARWYDSGTGSFTSRDSYALDPTPSVEANRYTYGNADPLNHTDPTGHWPKWIKKAASKVSSGAKWVGNKVSSGAKWVADKVSSGAKWVADKVVSGARWVGNQISSGVSWVSSKISSGARWLGNKISSGANYVRNQSTRVYKSAAQIYRESKQYISDKARAAKKYIATHNPIPVLAQALRPVYAGMKTAVQIAVNIPAAIVQETKHFVQDVAKVATEVAKIVADVSAQMVSAVDTAITAVSEFAQTAAPYLKAGLEFAAEVTGVNDAIKCATKGDVEACLWTAVTVASVFVPGSTAAVRGAKAARMAGKVEHFAKGSKAAEKVEEAAGTACKINSFTPETLVVMADGTTKPIKDIQIGEKVLATDPTTGRTEARPVEDVIVGNGEKHLVRLTIDTDGDKGDATDTITATEGHPFWLEDQHTWVKANEIKPGALLRTSAGTWVKVLATRAWTAVQQVFNLSVGGIHTYYVQAGAAPVLAHNNCDGESFYRAMSEKEFNQLGPNGEITVKGTENFVTQSRDYLEGLRGRTARKGGRNAEKYTILVRFEMQSGTRDALISAGKTPGEIGKDINAVHLKSERGADTFGLRPGSVGVFNSRITKFGRVNDW
ncbi:DNRLRE domain-containing protein [Streptomyces olivoreticuli]|uniref:DNRLRE domain-containing protein n=1 Tax=Streptomyces olivoreticuli TaxID=68246 RepID=UPI0013C35CB3|nr:DNRLRE domain-containing protein [Streptomyces olivoreticuli]